MAELRWYLRWAWIRFVCWYADHRWLNAGATEVCTRCYGAVRVKP